MGHLLLAIMYIKWGGTEMLKKITSALIAIIVVMAFIPFDYADASGKTELNTSSISIVKGMTYSYSVKNLPKGATTNWSISDKFVASVTKAGVVKGLSEGKATVTCKVKRPGKKALTLKSTVNVKRPKFASSSYTLATGESKTLSLKNKVSSSTYKWSSDNTD